MSISLLDEGPLIPLAQASKLAIFRRGGKAPRRETIWRWAQRGCRGVMLETILLPQGLATTEAACRRFIAGLSMAQDSASACLRHSKNGDMADALLDAEGL